MQKLKQIEGRFKVDVRGNLEKTLNACAKEFVEIVSDSINLRGNAYVALSGGSTPKAIFERISKTPYKDQIDWSSVYLYWSDERCVPPDNPDSNYKMAMDAGLATLPIPAGHIVRFEGEIDPQEAAKKYHAAIEAIPDQTFDLMMLGLGTDGHTASLFPHTRGLEEKQKWATANWIPQKQCDRLTLTYRSINRSRHIAIYALGTTKTSIVRTILDGTWNPALYPVQNIGTTSSAAHLILDTEAARQL